MKILLKHGRFTHVAPVAFPSFAEWKREQRRRLFVSRLIQGRAIRDFVTIPKQTAWLPGKVVSR